MVGVQRSNANHVRKIGSVVRSAQRHKGGGSGLRPQRGTAAELSAPLTRSHEA
jgi:hypothetical protein